MTILVIGMICYDVVNTCDRFPHEDEEMRCLSQREQQGGNAANSSYVLGLLNARCEFFGNIGKGLRTDFVLKRLDKVGVSHEHCIITDKVLPNSSITLSLATGTRTTVHYRDFPELTFNDFKQLNLSAYSWIHFEGRKDEADVQKMIQRVMEFNANLSEERRITISMEFERPREALIPLMSLPDVLMVGKVFNEFLGHHTAEEAASHLRKSCKDSALIFCAWGDKGAVASAPGGEVHRVDAFAPGPIIDTLGAGDTFNAGIIYSLSRGKPWKEAVEFACRLAGTKCCSPGYNAVQTLAES